MSWSVAQEAVRLAVAQCVGALDYEGADGLTYHATEWEGRETASNWGSPVANVELRLGPVWNSGQDETRAEMVLEAGLPVRKETNTGNRRFTVTVSIFVPNQTPGAEAVGELADRLRTRLWSSRIQKLLNAGKVSLVAVRPTREADYMNMEGRIESRSFTDLELLTTSSWTDPLQDGHFIETVRGTGEFAAGHDGQPVQLELDVSA